MHSVKRVRSSREAVERKRQQDAVKIARYRGLIEKAKLMRSQNIKSEESFALTTTILQQNPENYTAWNYRREILNIPQFSKYLSEELRFIESLLRSWPKVYWIWNHRRWVLEKLDRPDWNRELKLVNMMLDLDARNFHGWHYRRYVVDHIEKATSTPLTQSEFDYTTSKINANFSNFSAWHNRTKLIGVMLQDKEHFPKEPLDLLLSELAYITQAIYTDPDDQSAWLYHRWLVIGGIEVDSKDRIEIVKQQIRSIEELFEVEPDSKWCIYFLAEYITFLAKLENRKLTEDEKSSVVGFWNKLQLVDPMRKKKYEYFEKNIYSAT